MTAPNADELLTAIAREPAVIAELGIVAAELRAIQDAKRALVALGPTALRVAFERRAPRAQVGDQ